MTNSPLSTGPVPEAFLSFLASQGIPYTEAVSCSDPGKTIAIRYDSGNIFQRQGNDKNVSFFCTC